MEKEAQGKRNSSLISSEKMQSQKNCECMFLGAQDIKLIGLVFGKSNTKSLFQLLGSFLDNTRGIPVLRAGFVCFVV